MYKGLILSLVLLSGCASTSVPTVVEPVKYYPPMPAPLQVCDVRWEVLEVNELAKVALSYNDNVTMAICLRDIERYISQLLSVACHDRQDLKEKVCNVSKSK